MEESRVRYSKLSMMTATKRFSICGDPRGQEGVRESETHPNTYTQRPRGREGGREKREKEVRERDGGRQRKDTRSQKEPGNRDMEKWRWGERQIETETKIDTVGERGGEVM